MRVDVRVADVPISRFPAGLGLPAALRTTVAALVSDVRRGGRPVVGYGFASVGRAPVTALIRDRFADRLVAALAAVDGEHLDPFSVAPQLMAGEKPGGHGERCVAVGTLDLALWDLAAKLAGEPLHAHLARRLGRRPTQERVRVYAAGGYRYPDVDAATDRRMLADEIRRLTDLGYTHVKMKIADSPPDEDLRRIDAAVAALGDPGRLAVDALNRYSPVQALDMAERLRPYGLWWWEDVCDPLDFAAQADVVTRYPGAIAAGEALFSHPDARNLRRHGGLRPGLDRLVFDPVHCYGVPEYLRIVEEFETAGWNRDAFWPHGGHLFCLHLTAALGLGGSELTPLAFAPFGGPPDGGQVRDGELELPAAPGVGFETRAELRELLGNVGGP